MPTEPHPDEGLHSVIVELIRDIFAAHGKVSCWVHDFTGKVEAETYEISDHLDCPVDELPTVAPGLMTDVVVNISVSNIMGDLKRVDTFR